MDCVDDRQPVQTWRSQIIAKVTRLSVEDDDDDDDEDFQRPPVHERPPQPTPQPRAPAPTPAAHFDIFDGPAAAPAPPQQHVTGNLLDGHHQAPPNHGGGGLLDMNYQPQQPQQHNDFLGMATHSPPVSGNYGNQSQQQKQPPRQQGSFDTFGSQGGAFF